MPEHRHGGGISVVSTSDHNLFNCMALDPINVVFACTKAVFA
jgi:hypothetical protein